MSFHVPFRRPDGFGKIANGLSRISSGGGLPCHHYRRRAVEHGIEDIADLCSRRNSVLFHGGKHLRHDHERHTRFSTGGSNGFLCGRKLPERHGVAEIAARDNDFVSMRQCGETIFAPENLLEKTSTHKSGKVQETTDEQGVCWTMDAPDEGSMSAVVWRVVLDQEQLELRKSLAFQFGQAIALNDGSELFTKRDIAEYIPSLRPYLYRETCPMDDLEDIKLWKSAQKL